MRCTNVLVQDGPVFRGLGSTEEAAKNRASEQMIRGLYVWGLQGGTVQYIHMITAPLSSGNNFFKLV